MCPKTKAAALSIGGIAPALIHGAQGGDPPQRPGLGGDLVGLEGDLEDVVQGRAGGQAVHGAAVRPRVPLRGRGADGADLDHRQRREQDLRRGLRQDAVDAVPRGPVQEEAVHEARGVVRALGQRLGAQVLRDLRPQDHRLQRPVGVFAGVLLRAEGQDVLIHAAGGQGGVIWQTPTVEGGGGAGVIWQDPPPLQVKPAPHPKPKNFSSGEKRNFEWSQK